MEKRKLDDLWTEAYLRFGPSLKAQYGLDSRTHIRYQKRSSGTSCIVYVVKRRTPSQGYIQGNFTIDEITLDWILKQQNRKRVEISYIALVEDFGDPVLNYDTAKNVSRLLTDENVSTNSDGGRYYWIDENFRPSFSRNPRDAAREISKPPF